MAPKTIASTGAKDQSSIDLPTLKAIPRRRRGRSVKSDAHSYVYLMENRATGLIKVGRTTQLSVRIAAVVQSRGTQDGERAYWGWVAVNKESAGKLEAALHREWADVRCDGEWFDLRGKPVREDVHRVATSLCGADFKVSGLHVDEEPPEETWSAGYELPFKPGGISGRRIG
jgi:hypothetical protein